MPRTTFPSAFSPVSFSSLSLVDQAEGDDIAADVELCPLLGQVGQADKAGFGGRVVGLPIVAVLAGDGHDIDDLAHHPPAGSHLAGLVAEVRSQRSQEPVARRQVDRQHGVPLLVRHLVEHGVPGISCRVQDDVRRRCERPPARPAISVLEVRRGHVAGHAESPAAGPDDPVRRCLGGFRVKVIDHQRRAVTGQHESAGLADAPAGSGDDCHPAIQHARSGTLLASRPISLAAAVCLPSLADAQGVQINSYDLIGAGSSRSYPPGQAGSGRTDGRPCRLPEARTARPPSRWGPSLLPASL